MNSNGHTYTNTQSSVGNKLQQPSAAQARVQPKASALALWQVNNHCLEVLFFTPTENAGVRGMENTSFMTEADVFSKK